MAILKIRDENGTVHEIMALRGESANSIGAENIVSGQYASARGYGNVVSGARATADGKLNKAIANNSNAHGCETQANEKNAFTYGYGGIANGESALAGGNSTQANGAQSVALGDHSVASGSNALAVGLQSKAVGSKSFAGGTATNNKAENAILFGEGGTTESGAVASLGGGKGAWIVQKYAIAWGELVSALGSIRAVFGKYNAYGKDKLTFAIGNGTSDNERSNAFEVYEDGTARVQTQGTTKDSVVQKQYVDDQIEQLKKAINALGGTV